MYKTDELANSTNKHSTTYTKQNSEWYMHKHNKTLQHQRQERNLKLKKKMIEHLKRNKCQTTADFSNTTMETRK